MLERPTWKTQTVVFFSSQVLSNLGTSLVQYALLWYVTLRTGSGVMMTLYTVCGFVPTFLLSPFAGVWADRYDRRKLIMLSDALIALITLALALAFLAGEEALSSSRRQSGGQVARSRGPPWAPSCRSSCHRTGSCA
jgi:MFS family permease